MTSTILVCFDWETVEFLCNLLWNKIISLFFLVILFFYKYLALKIRHWIHFKLCLYKLEIEIFISLLHLWGLSKQYIYLVLPHLQHCEAVQGHWYLRGLRWVLEALWQSKFYCFFLYSGLCLEASNWLSTFDFSF